MYPHQLLRLLALSFLLFGSASAQKLELVAVDSKTNASFRGLSVVNDSVAWVCGTNGWFGISVDGGKDWSFRRVSGFEQCDFRSLYAFSATKAVMANAGSPAYILYTSDAGLSWQKVYENDDSAAFIDGMDFWDHKYGMIYGDPINNHMLLAGTKDGGKTWTQRPAGQCPVMSPGEASFAASNTGIRCSGRKNLMIATGGNVARVLISKNRGRSFRAISAPIRQGTAGTGIFTILPLGKRLWVVAGGDYKNVSLRPGNLFITDNGGRNWDAPDPSTRGYTECLLLVKHIDALEIREFSMGEIMTGKNENTLLAVGPEGFDISYNNGRKWKPLSDEKQYHVAKKSRTGNLIIAAGGQGKIAILRMQK